MFSFLQISWLKQSLNLIKLAVTIHHFRKMKTTLLPMMTTSGQQDTLPIFLKCERSLQVLFQKLILNKN